MTLDRKVKNTLLMEIFGSLQLMNEESLREILETIFNSVMKIERDQALNAAPYERNEERKGICQWI